MKLQLTKDRQLTSDTYGYQLRKKVTIKGEEQWQSYLYFGNMASAIKQVPEQILRESDAEGITEILRFLRSTETKLLNSLGVKAAWVQ